MTSVQDSCLYLIPVPMSPDSTPEQVLPLQVLQTVKSLRCFFVEDLRSARRFLKAVDRGFDIDACEFYVLDEHSTSTEVEQYITPLLKHRAAGVISEAGCPGIADPGALVVELARRNKFRVIPLVGPSSIIMSLMASGFNGQNFAFHGYLPHDTAQRKKRLQEFQRNIAAHNQTQIFIETPYRNNKLIASLSNELPSHLRLCVACDLTSPDETIIIKTVGEWRNSSYDFSRRPSIFLINS